MRIDESVVARIRECIALAPLHNPHNLSTYESCRRRMPGAAHVAVFDTAFHQTLPPAAYTYGLPFEVCARYKLRRYGFHGTSHRYVALRFAQIHRRPPEGFGTSSPATWGTAARCAPSTAAVPSIPAWA